MSNEIKIQLVQERMVLNYGGSEARIEIEDM